MKNFSNCLSVTSLNDEIVDHRGKRVVTADAFVKRLLLRRGVGSARLIVNSREKTNPIKHGPLKTLIGLHVT